MRILEKFKQFISCKSNSIKLKSSCFARSSCCKGDINVDIDGDNIADINIKRVDSDEIEITMLKEKNEK
jgi:hypothetical protein